MRLALPLALLALAACSARAAEYPPLAVPEAESARFGRLIQRSMRLLATSTPERRNTVRILFYGQSITEQKWADLVLADLKRRFPHADIVAENRALGGFASQMLVRTAETDLYPFEPDLLIFHVYGAHNTYEDIIRRTRERTTADILIQTDHVTKPGDFDEETDPAKLPPAGKHWDAFMNHNHLPSVAKKYGAELCDQRTLWKRYLKDHKLPPSALLSDSVHLNAHGEFLMAECVKAYLRYDPSMGEEYAAGRVAEIPVPQDGDSFKIKFEGSRVDAVIGRAGRRVEVLVDSVPPSRFPGAYARTRAVATPGGKWPVVAGFGGDATPVVEDWSMRLTRDPADAKRYTFTLKGSVTGEDGSGSTDKPFRSESGRVAIEPDAWNVEYAYALSHLRKAPDAFDVKWSVVPTHADIFAPVPGMKEWTLARGLPNGKHTLELRGDLNAVSAIRVYRPR